MPDHEKLIIEAAERILSEISHSKIGRYMKWAVQDIDHNRYNAGFEAGHDVGSGASTAKNPKGSAKNPISREFARNVDRTDRRRRGIDMAVSRLTGEPHGRRGHHWNMEPRDWHVAKEEIDIDGETLSEISDDLRRRYVKRAIDDVSRGAFERGRKDITHSSGEEGARAARRMNGIVDAGKKLGVRNSRKLTRDVAIASHVHGHETNMSERGRSEVWRDKAEKKLSTARKKFNLRHGID